MSSIDELMEKVKGIYDELSEIKERQQKERQSTGVEDVKALFKILPIKNHIIINQSDFIKKTYLTVLGGIINETLDEFIRITQIEFFKRIFVTADIKGEVLENFVSKANTLNEVVLNDMIENFDDNLIKSFVVDALIIANICGKIEENEVKMLGAICSLFKFTNNEMSEICKFAKSILIDDEKNVLSCKYVNVNYFVGYLQKEFNGIIVNELSTDKFYEEPIHIFNKKYENLREIINIDKYSKELYFYNCVFENIVGMQGIESKAHFYNCEFKNITVSNENKNTYDLKGAVFNLKNAEILDCLFENCNIQKQPLLYVIEGKTERTRFIDCKVQGIDDNTGLFVFINTNISNCEFKNCEIKTDNRDRRNTRTTVVDVHNGKLSNSIFDNCSAYCDTLYGSLAIFYSHMVRGINSIIKECKFKKCSCSSKYERDAYDHLYLIGLVNSQEENNDFSGCEDEINHRYSSLRAYGESNMSGDIFDTLNSMLDRLR